MVSMIRQRFVCHRSLARKKEQGYHFLTLPFKYKNPHKLRIVIFLLITRGTTFNYKPFSYKVGSTYYGWESKVSRFHNYFVFDCRFIFTFKASFYPKQKNCKHKSRPNKGVRNACTPHSKILVILFSLDLVKYCKGKAEH